MYLIISLFNVKVGEEGHYHYLIWSNCPYMSANTWFLNEQYFSPPNIFRKITALTLKKSLDCSNFSTWIECWGEAYIDWTCVDTKRLHIGKKAVLFQHIWLKIMTENTYWRGIYCPNFVNTKLSLLKLQGGKPQR